MMKMAVAADATAEWSPHSTSLSFQSSYDIPAVVPRHCDPKVDCLRVTAKRRRHVRAIHLCVTCHLLVLHLGLHEDACFDRLPRREVLDILLYLPASFYVWILSLVRDVHAFHSCNCPSFA